MSDKIQHFLLVFDHAEGRLTHQDEFGVDIQAALLAYRAMERHYDGRTDVEIVLIGSDSIETVKVTHANYYDGSLSGSVFLAGI